MDNLYEVSQINEVNREWAAQILSTIDRYKGEFKAEKEDNPILDKIRELTVELYRNAFRPETIEEAKNNKSQLKILQAIVNTLEEKKK